MLHMFSDVRRFQHDPLAFLLERGNGAPLGLERLRLGPSPVFLVTDPNLIRPILKAPETHVGKGRLIKKLSPIIGNSSLVLHGDEHKRRRAVLQRHMAKGSVERYLPQMCAEIRAVGAKIAKLGTFDPHTFTAALALRIICVATFGAQVISPGDEEVLVQAVNLVEDDIADEMFRALPYGPIGSYRRRKRRNFAKQTMALVVSRLRSVAAASSALKELEDLQLSDTDLNDEILTLLLAGHHTTGSTGAWIFHHLAREPGLLAQIAMEADRCSNEDGELCVEKVKRAEVSTTFVREVCRLYPSAWWFSREVLQSTEIAGYKLKRGTSLIICPWQLQRDPRNFEDPATFSMQRRYTSDAYVPFGAGARACAGMGVAMLELQLLALEMAAAYEFSTDAPDAGLQPKASVTLLPPPMNISVRLRSAKPQELALLVG